MTEELRTVILRGRAAVLSALTLLLIGLLSPGAYAQQGVGAEAVRPSELEILVRDRLEAFREEIGFPGATAAYVLPDGTVGAVAVGYSDQEAKVAMTVADKLLSGSVGKTYVAAVALQLVGEGKLILDKRIEEWLGGEDWFPRLPNSADITVRMLMNHTSGISEHVLNSDFGDAIAADPDRVWRPAELLRYILDAKPLFEAGKGWVYADTNYIVLGMIIEKITGRAFYDELEARVLEPLGLEETVPSDSRVIDGLAPGYAAEFSPFKKPGKTIINGKFVINPQLEWTGGGLACTTRDLARWARALFSGKAFPGELMDQYLDGVPARTGPGDRYGLGVQIWDTPLGTCYGHGGWFPGYLTQMGYYKDLDLIVAVQFNTDAAPGITVKLLPILDEVAAILKK